MNQTLYLNNKLRIYQKIHNKQTELLQLYMEAISIRRQYSINDEKLQENKAKINRIKQEIQSLQDRITLLTL